MARKLSIVVHARPSSVTRRLRREVVGELDRLESEGVVEYEVRTWPDQVEVDDASPDLLSTVRTYERWGERVGVSLEPCFDQRTYERPITGESGEMLTLPGVALAAYADEEVVTVVPYTNGEDHVTVDEYLSWLGDAVTDAETGRPEKVVVE